VATGCSTFLGHRLVRGGQARSGYLREVRHDFVSIFQPASSKRYLGHDRQQGVDSAISANDSSPSEAVSKSASVNDDSWPIGDGHAGKRMCAATISALIPVLSTSYQVPGTSPSYAAPSIKARASRCRRRGAWRQRPGTSYSVRSHRGEAVRCGQRGGMLDDFVRRASYWVRSASSWSGSFVGDSSTRLIQMSRRQPHSRPSQNDHQRTF